MYRLRTEDKHMQVRGEGVMVARRWTLQEAKATRHCYTAVASQTCLALYYDPQASGSLLCTRCTSNLRGLDLPGCQGGHPLDRYVDRGTPSLVIHHHVWF